MTEFKGISHKELIDTLSYDPETGIFKWKKQVGQRCRIGEKAGCLDNSSGYEKIKVLNKNYKSHRLAWFYVHKVMPLSVDHINHIRTDNRIENLRNVSHKDNHKNRPVNKNNRSGVCGVNFRTDSNAWIASIRVDGRSIHLGSFRCKTAAIFARKIADKKYNFHENHGLKATEL